AALRFRVIDAHREHAARHQQAGHEGIGDQVADAHLASPAAKASGWTKGTCAASFGAANTKLFLSNFGCVFQVSTAENCGSPTSCRVVMTILRGSARAPFSTHSCQSASA